MHILIGGNTELLGFPNGIRMLGVDLFWKSSSAEGFTLHIHTPPDAKEDLLLPWIEHCITETQGWLDKMHAKGYPLERVLNTMAEELDKIGAMSVEGRTADRSVPSQALANLLVMRSFGRANDDDDHNGILLTCASDPYVLPMLKYGK